MNRQTHGPSRKLMLLREAIEQNHPDIAFKVLTEDPSPLYPNDYSLRIDYPRRLEPASKLIRAWKYYWRARLIYREFPFTHLVFNDAPMAIMAAISPLPAGVQLVAMLNDDDNIDRNARSYESGKKRWWRKSMSVIEGFVVRNSSAVITCSNYLAERIDTAYHPEKRAVVLHPSLRLSEWRGFSPKPPTNRPSLLFVKSDFLRGGLQDLISALAEDNLALRFASLEIGGVSEEDFQNQFGESITNKISIHVHGSVDRKTYHRLLEGCHIGVVPSRHEGFGITVLEFAAAGLLPIISNAGGLPEAIANHQHLTFPAGNVEELRLVLERAADQVGEARHIDKISIKYGHFEMAERFLDLLAGV